MAVAPLVNMRLGNSDGYGNNHGGTYQTFRRRLDRHSPCTHARYHRRVYRKQYDHKTKGGTE